MENQVRVGIGVIVEKDNQILLGHRVVKAADTGGIYEPDTWTLPGGKQEFNETIYECAKRETKEETNLDVDNLCVVAVNDDFGPNKHYVTIGVKASSVNGDYDIMEPDKIDKWCFFDINNLPDNIYSPSKKTIEGYLKRGKINNG